MDVDNIDKVNNDMDTSKDFKIPKKKSKSFNLKGRNKRKRSRSRPLGAGVTHKRTGKRKRRK